MTLTSDQARELRIDLDVGAVRVVEGAVQSWSDDGRGWVVEGTVADLVPPVPAPAPGWGNDGEPTMAAEALHYAWHGYSELDGSPGLETEFDGYSAFRLLQNSVAVETRTEDRVRWEFPDGSWVTAELDAWSDDALIDCDSALSWDWDPATSAHM